MQKLKTILLDHTLFIVLVSIFSGFVVAMLIYLQFFCERKDTDVREIMAVEWYRPTVSFPLTLHAAGFSPDELLLLGKVVGVWEEATHGRAAIRVVPWQPDGPFDDQKYQAYEKYTIWHLDGNDRAVAELFVQHSVSMGGLCKGRYIGILNDLDPAEFRGVVLHELGHLMALEHVKPEFECLMNRTSKGIITPWDIMQFDHLYLQGGK